MRMRPSRRHFQSQCNEGDHSRAYSSPGKSSTPCRQHRDHHSSRRTTSTWRKCQFPITSPLVNPQLSSASNKVTRLHSHRRYAQAHQPSHFTDDHHLTSNNCHSLMRLAARCHHWRSSPFQCYHHRQPRPMALPRQSEQPCLQDACPSPISILSLVSVLPFRRQASR